jgi:hypothetical protein
MKNQTEFDAADQEVGASEVIEGNNGRSSRALRSANTIEYRDQLVARYHKGAKTLVERLRVSGNSDVESLLMSLIHEVIQETDNLLGNELVSAENGDLRDSSIISFKRAEVLEKAIRAVQARQHFERERGLDLDSPAMMVVFRYFMSKVKTALVQTNAPDEMSDLLFKVLSEEMADWKKELRQQFDSMRSAG